MRNLILLLATLALTATPASAQSVVLTESVTGGSLDLVWYPGFFLPNNLEPLTLTPDHPAYDNPSGDRTVGSLTNAAPDFGGIAKSVIDPLGHADYRWEGHVFTGDGNTRRGLVVRAQDASTGFTACYQFVIQPGLLNLNFRRLSGEGAITLGTWFTTSTASGFPAVNTWQHMAVEARGDEFRVWWNGEELTTTPIVDGTLQDGYVGVYNFRFDLGGVPVYFDDLQLSAFEPVDVNDESWGAVKSLFGN